MSATPDRLAARCRGCGTIRFPRGTTRAAPCCRGAPQEPLAVREAVSLALATAQDEFAAAELLFELRFGDGWGCEACGHRRCTHLRCRPRVFECTACGRGVRVTAGTSLHRCRLPLVEVLRAVRLLVRPGRSISARALSRELGVTLETAWSLAHRLRAGFLDAPPVRVADEVVWSSCNVTLRVPRGAPPPGVLDRARFVVLWDRWGRMAVATGRPDPHALRRFVDRHADVARPFAAPFLYPENPWAFVNRTHRGLSERWLPVYLHAIAGWHEARRRGGCAAVATLWWTLRGRRHPFRVLRPKEPVTRGPEAHEATMDHSRRWSERRMSRVTDRDPAEVAESAAAAHSLW